MHTCDSHDVSGLNKSIKGLSYYKTTTWHIHTKSTEMHLKLHAVVQRCTPEDRKPYHYD